MILTAIKELESKAVAEEVSQSSAKRNTDRRGSETYNSMESDTSAGAQSTWPTSFYSKLKSSSKARL